MAIYHPLSMNVTINSASQQIHIFAKQEFFWSRGTLRRRKVLEKQYGLVFCFVV